MMYNVLLADDDPTILNGLKTIIHWNELGLNLAAAVPDGESALAYIRANPVDILVTDICMKELDGLALISAVHDFSPNTRCIVLTGYSDFAYTKKAIQLGIENYILKPVDEDELKLTLTNLIAKLEEDASKDKNSIYEFRDAIVYRWITGKIDINSFQHRADVLDIDLTQNFFQVAVFRVQNYDLALQQNSTASEKMILRTIGAQMKQLKQVKFAACRGEKDDFLVALWGELDKCKDEIMQVMRSISQLLGKLNLNVKTALGKRQEDFMQMCASYQDAMFLVEFGLILPQGTVADNMTVAALMNERSTPLTIDPKELLQAVSEQDVDKIESFIKRVKQLLLQSVVRTPNEMKKPVMELIYAVSQMKSGTVVQGEYDIVKVFNDAMQQQTVDGLLQLLRNAAMEKVKKLHKAENDMSLHVVRAIEAIKRGENVTLKTLADKYKISPVYLGQLFKNETGMLFTDYLNKVRIKKSIELLQQTDKTIAEIAELAGYASYGYFCSVFKKVTGAYPKDYRTKEAVKQ